MSALSDKQISVEKARELQKNWISNQGAAINESMKMTDVRDFLFDLEELQEYINMVRDKSKEEGILNPGLRIYFGAYGEEGERRATVFLQATKGSDTLTRSNSTEEGDQEANNTDIQPLNTVQGGFPPIDY